MLNDYILSLPKDIREKCIVEEDRVCIAKRVTQAQLEKAFGPAIEDPEQRIIRALAVTTKKKPKRHKPIRELLSTGGR